MLEGEAGESLRKAKCSRDLVERLCSCPGKYCTLKEVVIHLNGYTIEQIKFLELYKWDRAKTKEDFTWDDAAMEWADKGYAKVYHDLFDPDIDPKVLYDLVKTKNLQDHPECRHDFC